MIEYGHNHEERPSKPADLGADDDIIFPDSFQQFAQTALVDFFGSAGRLAYPFIHLQAVVTAEPLNFKSLVLYRLTVGADPDVSVDHKRYYVKSVQT